MAGLGRLYSAQNRSSKEGRDTRTFTGISHTLILATIFNLLRSKMKTAIVFDGEEEMNLTARDIKKIREGSPRELVKYFQATTVYRDVMKDLIKDLGSALLSLNETNITPERVRGIELGYQLLSQELIAAFGEESAGMIIAQVYNAINLEKGEGAE